MIKTLKETVDLMISSDYKERFEAEYYQLYIRLEKLVGMLKKWDDGTLDFNPTVPRDLYNEQVMAMDEYLSILEKRAEIEGIDLGVDDVLLQDVCQ